MTTNYRRVLAYVKQVADRDVLVDSAQIARTVFGVQFPSEAAGNALEVVERLLENKTRFERDGISWTGYRGKGRKFRRVGTSVLVLDRDRTALRTAEIETRLRKASEEHLEEVHPAPAGEELRIPLGLVVQAANTDARYVYIGSRFTTSHSEEHVFARVIQVHWPSALRTYKASKPATLIRMFPALAEYFGPTEE